MAQVELPRTVCHVEWAGHWRNRGHALGMRGWIVGMIIRYLGEIIWIGQRLAMCMMGRNSPSTLVLQMLFREDVSQY